ncbi:sorbitol-6-phosphate dehydrogenase [Caldilinea sp.]|uniref:sorbitol-6-phosphate dehydrogenase n=1 Tax=Caldilinea sp. TaxID=2293560 RepID=UPI002CF5CDFE|nr:sorbitol-6-phosphate dehydrogenase [Caldilinea sp.]
MSQLTGRVALVTGGAQGLGAALCLRLAREGCDVMVADLNSEQATQTADAVAQETGRRCMAVTVNVANEEQVRAMVEATVEVFGRLDILVANAGVVRAGPVDEMSLRDWQLVMDVNLTGYFLCAKHVAAVMKRQHSGAIVQINSKSGKKGSFKNGAYAASKFGGVGLTQSIALELAEHGVRVNAVCPGNLLDSPLWVESLYSQYSKRLGISEEEVRQRYIDQVPMRRGCTYEDVANAVVFLASDQSSYMTGQAINVTGGQEMR